MAVYVIFSYDVVDAEAYQQYVAGVGPLLMKHGAEVLTAAHGVDALEGTARTNNIVLEFASEEAARAWYEDPEYEPVKQIRLDSTENCTGLIAPEFVMPGS